MPQHRADPSNPPAPTFARPPISRLYLIFLAPALAILVGCGSDGSTNAIVRGPQVFIVGNPLGNPDSLFKPATLHIRAGQTVTWTDHDDQSHTVTPDVPYAGWAGGSDVLSHGRSYQHRFTRPGTYRYYCTVHANMIGTVVVAR